MAMILDGKKLSVELRDSLRAEVLAFTAGANRPPGLHVILVGSNPASQVYTRNKEKTARALGFASCLHELPEAATELEVLALIQRLNCDDAVDGILVQLPLPKHLATAGAESRILWSVDPAKDVDGFHPVNAGRLALGAEAIVPATPKGCMLLLKASGVTLAGAHAVVLGRSNIVGKPMAQLLLAADATVTIAHSKTTNLSALCRTADILVAAVGRPEMVRADFVKPGAVVIDVGINRIDSDIAETPSRLVGDVHFESVSKVAGALTPVPGGVGPMTIACLMQNTLLAAMARHRSRTPV
jgi:methylenetetrahydrofolate dehydrogenase (NADP+) / methenyltetrahydrofolate cyclohydrolase